MLTVIFATLNGAGRLPEVFASYGRLAPPQGGWKLVVVDNDSKDGTGALVESWRDRLPLVSLTESAPGKNAALNTGLAHLEGDLAVFTDDDVFPHPDWLVQLRAAADANTGHTIFGGRVLPRWEVPPPQWVVRWVPPGPVFTLTDTSLRGGPTGAHTVFGPNMAIRAEVFASGARFATSIGPQGRDYAMGSETELVRRLLRRGHEAWHVPEAVVEHFIRKTQMTQQWVLGRAARFGRGQFRLTYADAPLAARALRGVPLFLYRQLMGEMAAVLKAECRFDAEAAFRARWELNYIRGQMREARVIRAEAESDAARTRRQVS